MKTVQINPTSGTAPYEYSIDSGTTWQTSNVFTVQEGNTYIFWIRDANGCLTQTTIAVPVDNRIDPEDCPCEPHINAFIKTHPTNSGPTGTVVVEIAPNECCDQKGDAVYTITTLPQLSPGFTWTTNLPITFPSLTNGVASVSLEFTNDNSIITDPFVVGIDIYGCSCSMPENVKVFFSDIYPPCEPKLLINGSNITGLIPTGIPTQLPISFNVKKQCCEITKIKIDVSENTPLPSNFSWDNPFPFEGTDLVLNWDGTAFNPFNIDFLIWGCECVDPVVYSIFVGSIYNCLPIASINLGNVYFSSTTPTYYLPFLAFPMEENKPYSDGMIYMKIDHSLCCSIDETLIEFENFLSLPLNQQHVTFGTTVVQPNGDINIPVAFDGTVQWCAPAKFRFRSCWNEECQKYDVDFYFYIPPWLPCQCTLPPYVIE